MRSKRITFYERDEKHYLPYDDDYDDMTRVKYTALETKKLNTRLTVGVGL